MIEFQVIFDHYLFKTLCHLRHRLRYGPKKKLGLLPIKETIPFKGKIK